MKVAEKHLELLISIIEEVDKKLSNRKHRHPLTEKEENKERYREITNVLRKHITDLNDATNNNILLTDIHSLKVIRQQLIDKPKNFMFQRSDEEVKEILQNIDNKIENLQYQLKEKEKITQLFETTISEIIFQLQLVEFIK